MEKINELITAIKNIDLTTIVDFVIAIWVIILFKILSAFLAYIIIKMFKIKDSKKKIKENGLYVPLKAFISLAGVYLAILILKLPQETMGFVNRIARVIIICLVAKGFANIVNPKSRIFIHFKEHSRIDNTILIFICRICKALIYLIAGFIILNEFGYNLNGLAAGLGISGAVVALAAQDFAKNLFGGFAILTDKPFIVGDWIQTKQIEGTVIDITFRSSKIRGIDDTVVTVPNAILADESIVNWNRISKRRYAFDLGFEMETDIQKLQEIQAKIQFILENNEKIEKESIRVYVDKIKEDSINLSIAVYISETDFTKYLIEKEKINYAVLELIEKEKIELAYPTQSICIKK